MYTLCIQGFKTKEQVEDFISWYEGHGEQDIYTWLECGNSDVSSMNMDMGFGTNWFDNIALIKIRPLSSED